MAGPDSSTMKYTPTFDKGKNVAHKTQSDGFRPVSGPDAAPHKAGSTSPRTAQGGGGGSVTMSNKKVCQRCGKTVYHAEEQLYDGMTFHISCFPMWDKEQKAKDLAPRNSSYDRAADVQPTYYRADVDGSGPKLESGVEYKGAEGPAAKDATKFCANCGAKRGATAKFCGECGGKY